MTSYGEMKLGELRKELKLRGAKTSGRKQELVERLEAYDRNFNFGYFQVENEQQKMEIPSGSEFQDINSDSIIPKISKEAIENYLHQNKIFKIPDTSIQMYHNSFLTVVRSHASEKGTFLHGICKAEMKKNVVYNVYVLINSYAEVLECQCECAAGEGPSASCKHVVTLLLGAVNFTEAGDLKRFKTRTENRQIFHRPNGKYNGPPVPAEDLDFQRFKIDGSSKSDTKSNVCFDPRPNAFRQMAGYNSYVRSICVNFSHNKAHFPILQMYSCANMYALENDHDYFKEKLSDIHLQKLGLEVVKENGNGNLETQTRMQSKSALWHKERSIRLTSSNFGTICKLTDKKDVEKFMKTLLNSSDLNTKAVLHGRQYESVAVAKYIEITDKKVENCGLFIHQKKPYLAASPDGVVNLEGEKLLIEVKCPYSARNLKINNLTVPWLESVDGSLRLKKTHNYYYQIQGQMFVANANFSDLIIYTFEDFIIISVERDQDFIDNMVICLDDFYQNNFKCALKKKYFYLDK